MEPPLVLPQTLALLEHYWDRAESKVRKAISGIYKVHDEVFITRLLYGQLAKRFEKANRSQKFETAVHLDLRKLAETPELHEAARRITRGIIARVSYHEPHIEKVTGSDFGLTVVRPSFAVRDDALDFNSFMHSQGILCQAKRQNRMGKWGTFTEKQKQVLPSHISYLALLLYEYSGDPPETLRAFRWKSCKGQTINDIEQALESGAVDGTMPSSTIIHKLGHGSLGTSDEHIIRDTICAGDTAQLRIEITWEDGYRPQPTPPPTELLGTDLDKELEKQYVHKQPRRRHR